MSDEFELDTNDLERRMDGAIGNLRTELASLRTGRASGSMLEPGMSEDDQKLWESEVQELTDKYIKIVDETVETKQSEIMQV